MTVRVVLLVITLLGLRTCAATAQSRLGYYVELGGNGGWASVNLEARPISHLRARAGIGTLLWPTIPLTASWTLGSQRRSLEIGGGATTIFFPKGEPNDPFPQRFTELVLLGKGIGPVTLMTGILGYRYESPTGFTFRLRYTPYFGNGHVVNWIGVSLGGAF